MASVSNELQFLLFAVAGLNLTSKAITDFQLLYLDLTVNSDSVWHGTTCQHSVNRKSRDDCQGEFAMIK